MKHYCADHFRDYQSVCTAQHTVMLADLYHMGTCDFEHVIQILNPVSAFGAAQSQRERQKEEKLAITCQGRV